MRIKRFEAKDTQTAMTMVKRELGEDAIILATRSLPPEAKGKRSRIEVVAAMDYDLDEIEAVAQEQASSAPGYGYRTVRRPSPAEEIAIDPPLPAQAAAPKDTAPAHLESHDLRLRFADLIRQSGPPAVRYRPTDPGLKPPKTPPPQHDPTRVRQWRDEIIDKIQISEPEERVRISEPQGKIRGSARARILSDTDSDLKGTNNGAPMIIALVGATGVGKTTTAAKLAAWYTLRQGMRVALLSMDCYRIGATDQLRTYAQIMRLPCEIVLRRQDLTTALERHHEKDLIIIDTAGKSPYDQAHIQELQTWFAPCPDIMPYLVLSATAKKEDLHAIIDAYSPLSAAGLILTKLDETRAYAAICQQVVASSLPVSFLSTGQRVPEDFLAASKDFMDTLFKDGWDAAEPFLAARSGHYLAN